MKSLFPSKNKRGKTSQTGGSPELAEDRVAALVNEHGDLEEGFLGENILERFEEFDRDDGGDLNEHSSRSQHSHSSHSTADHSAASTSVSAGSGGDGGGSGGGGGRLRPFRKAASRLTGGAGTGFLSGKPKQKRVRARDFVPIPSFDEPEPQPQTTLPAATFLEQLGRRNALPPQASLAERSGSGASAAGAGHRNQHRRQFRRSGSGGVGGLAFQQRLLRSGAAAELANQRRRSQTPSLSSSSAAFLCCCFPKGGGGGGGFLGPLLDPSERDSVKSIVPWAAVAVVGLAVTTHMVASVGLILKIYIAAVRGDSDDDDDDDSGGASGDAALFLSLALAFSSLAYFLCWLLGLRLAASTLGQCCETKVPLPLWHRLVGAVPVVGVGVLCAYAPWLLATLVATSVLPQYFLLASFSLVQSELSAWACLAAASCALVVLLTPAHIVALVSIRNEKRVANLLELATRGRSGGEGGGGGRGGGRLRRQQRGDAGAVAVGSSSSSSSSNLSFWCCGSGGSVISRVYLSRLFNLLLVTTAPLLLDLLQCLPLFSVFYFGKHDSSTSTASLKSWEFALLTTGFFAPRFLLLFLETVARRVRLSSSSDNDLGSGAATDLASPNGTSGATTRVVADSFEYVRVGSILFDSAAGWLCTLACGSESGRRKFTSADRGAWADGRRALDPLYRLDQEGEGGGMGRYLARWKRFLAHLLVLCFPTTPALFLIFDNLAKQAAAGGRVALLGLHNGGGGGGVDQGRGEGGVSADAEDENDDALAFARRLNRAMRAVNTTDENSSSINDSGGNGGGGASSEAGGVAGVAGVAGSDGGATSGVSTTTAINSAHPTTSTTTGATTALHSRDEWGVDNEVEVDGEGESAVDRHRRRASETAAGSAEAAHRHRRRRRRRGLGLGDDGSDDGAGGGRGEGWGRRLVWRFTLCGERADRRRVEVGPEDKRNALLLAAYLVLSFGSQLYLCHSLGWPLAGSVGRYSKGLADGDHGVNHKVFSNQDDDDDDDNDGGGDGGGSGNASFGDGDDGLMSTATSRRAVSALCVFEFAVALGLAVSVAAAPSSVLGGVLWRRVRVAFVNRASLWFSTASRTRSGGGGGRV